MTQRFHNWEARGAQLWITGGSKCSVMISKGPERGSFSFTPLGLAAPLEHSQGWKELHGSAAAVCMRWRVRADL